MSAEPISSPIERSRDATNRIAQVANILIACHGLNAENAARLRQKRCARRGEPEWAALWRDVAGWIADRSMLAQHDVTLGLSNNLSG